MSSSSYCGCWLFCGLFKIICGYSFCRCCCCCCKDSHDSNKKTNGRKYKIEDWKEFLNHETNPVAQSDLDYMTQMYIKYNYSHKHYCFKTPGKRCNCFQCIHYETMICKGVAQHPALYLLVVNFQRAGEKYEPKNSDYENNKEKKHLEFIFQARFERTSKNDEVYKNIEDTIKNKMENVCLVIQDFPDEFKNNFQDKEKFILEEILTMRLYFHVPLIYNVR